MDKLNFQFGSTGPYILREDTIKAKMVNLSKSIAIEVRYENLPNIEGFLTNFN
jgi:hypothetical protein